ncbi:MAG: TRAP transporter small permease [Clostridia bacterium]|nr:TRAP transporter small permease [Clostridia bacterium]
MSTLKNLLIKFNRLIHKIMLLMSELAIVAMIIIVTATVVMRYCFNTGISWAEEVPRLLILVFAFAACAAGVRDHMHVSVTAIYNRFPVGGKGRKLMDIGVDVAALLCGLFMLISGGQRTAKLFSLTGKMPITGISVAWQYLPIPVAGAVMVFDSILFLTGILDPDDLIYSEKEIDFTDEAAVEALRASGEAAAAKED